MQAIVGGKIILEDTIVEGKALLFSEKIEGVCDGSEIPSDAAVIEAEGGYVAPGLIDLHIHGFLGRDVCDASEESLRLISGGLLENGVTGYLPTTMTVDMDNIKASVEMIGRLMEESRSWNGSRILGCHAEGPFINEGKKGAQVARHIKKPDADFVKAYKDILKIISLAPEKDTEDFRVIGEIKRKTDVVVSMGHTAADYETAKASMQAGVAHVTHLFNAMTPISHRAPGAAVAALGEDVSCELIADTFHVSPAFYDILWKVKGRKLCLITDCLPAGGLDEGAYALGGQKILYHDGICRLEDGTVAGSVLRLNRGVWNVYQNSSIPLWECVNAASLNPAAVLGLASEIGSLEKGKRADIIITDNTFGVRKTIMDGQIKYGA